jgi:hypothetical protein
MLDRSDACHSAKCDDNGEAGGGVLEGAQARSDGCLSVVLDE